MDILHVDTLHGHSHVDVDKQYGRDQVNLVLCLVQRWFMVVITISYLRPSIWSKPGPGGGLQEEV